MPESVPALQWKSPSPAPTPRSSLDPGAAALGPQAAGPAPASSSPTLARGPFADAPALQSGAPGGQHAAFFPEKIMGLPVGTYSSS